MKPVLGRKARGSVSIVILFTALALLAGELIVRVAAPRQTIRPAFVFDERYGILPPAGTRIRHSCPGRFRLVYTTNRLHHRGPLPESNMATAAGGVIVLGDSRAFGMGVEDGREFPAILHTLLHPRSLPVTNLAAPGWALSQQVRRYHELAPSIRPRAVVLQLNGNDFFEDADDPVAVVRADSISFRDVRRRGVGFLARSPLQESQIYVLLRDVIVERRHAREKDVAAGAGGEVPASLQHAYVRLLEAFVRRLARDGAILVVAAMDDDLAAAPRVRESLREMNDAGDLTFLRVDPWLATLGECRAPDGHRWNADAHARIAQELARKIPELVTASKIQRVRDR